MKDVRNMLKVGKLNKSAKNGHTWRACFGSMKCCEVGMSRMWRMTPKGCEKFRDMVKECINDICGMRCMGGQKRKGSEEVGLAV